MRGSREISLVPSLHRASTDALIHTKRTMRVHKSCSSSVKSCHGVYTLQLCMLLPLVESNTMEHTKCRV